MRQPQQDNNQLDNYVDLVQNVDRMNLNNDDYFYRDNGVFKNIYMPWEKKQQDILFQFKEIYTHRLRTLRTAFPLDDIKTIEDLSNDQKTCELVGLFKRIEAKRVRAFQNGFEDRYKNHQPIFSENDIYELEDQTGKVKLQIRPSTKFNGTDKFVPLETPYGVIVKCKGQYSPRINRFILSNVITPKPAIQSQMILPQGEPKFMVVLCQPKIQEINKLRIFIRNSLSKNNIDIRDVTIIGGMDYTNMNQIKEFDGAIFQLGALIDVFLIPSSCQQTSLIYPLGLIPKSLLQKSLAKKNVANCANPQLLKSKLINVNLDAFISCGQNLLDLKANCNIQDDLQLMKLILDYRHACPSSVFSLPIFSYKFDPLILESTPHLMIHGKCEFFQTDFWEKECTMQTINVRLVGMAKGDMVRVNLTSNNLQTLKWSV